MKFSLDYLKDGVDYISFHGDEKAEISGAISIFDMEDGKDYSSYIAWVGTKYLENLPKGVKLGMLILNQDDYEAVKDMDANFLLCDSPRFSFLGIVYKLAPKPEAGVEKTAVVHESTIMGKNCYIGHNVVIEEGVIMGDNCLIGHNTIIHKHTVMGNDVVIGSNCTIGSQGFAYEQDRNGNYLHIPHIGRVVLDDMVQIHNNTCLDRGVLTDTHLKKNVKVDNLVHVAHGVVIDENSLIIAHAMLGGSVVIGKNCWVAPNVAIKNKIKLEDDTFLGMGAVIVKDTKSGTVVIGNPGEEISQYKKWSKLKSKLISGSET